MSPARSSSGQPFFLSVLANCDSGVARSGVKGPLMCGSSDERSISTTWSYLAPVSAVSRSRCELHSLAMSPRRVAARYCAMRSLYGKSDVVAPISAPMLQMVPMPVALPSPA